MTRPTPVVSCSLLDPASTGESQYGTCKVRDTSKKQGPTGALALHPHCHIKKFDKRVSILQHTSVCSLLAGRREDGASERTVDPAIKAYRRHIAGEGSCIHMLAVRERHVCAAPSVATRASGSAVRCR
jgi:hypothetical protein